MISIDTVYQKVLTLSNKEQRGYVTPQEFNLLADKAQKEIINSYFHNIKTDFFKKKSLNESLDEMEIDQEKLSKIRHQLSVNTVLETTSDGRNIVRFRLPTDSYKIATIYLVSNGSTTFNPPVEVIRVDKNDLLNLQANPLTKPTISRPVYTHGAAMHWSYMEIYPMATYTGPTIDQYSTEVLLDGVTVEQLEDFNKYVGSTDGIQGVCGIGTDSEDNIVYDVGAKLLIDYWKIPAKPKWGYVVVNQKALYNSGDSVNFHLHPMEEEPLVMKILELAGITIEKPQLTKMAMVNQQQNKKEQNN